MCSFFPFETLGLALVSDQKKGLKMSYLNLTEMDGKFVSDQCLWQMISLGLNQLFFSGVAPLETCGKRFSYSGCLMFLLGQEIHQLISFQWWRMSKCQTCLTERSPWTVSVFPACFEFHFSVDELTFYLLSDESGREDQESQEEENKTKKKLFGGKGNWFTRST